MIIRVVFIGIGPAMGWLTDRHGLSTAFYTGGSVFMSVAVLLALFINVWRRDPHSPSFQSSSSSPS